MTNPTPIADGEVEALPWSDRLVGPEPTAWRIRERPGFDWQFYSGDPARNPKYRDYECQPLYGAAIVKAITARLTSLAEDNAELREALSSETAAREKAERDGLRRQTAALSQAQAFRDLYEKAERALEIERTVCKHRGVMLDEDAVAIADITRKLEAAERIEGVLVRYIAHVYTEEGTDFIDHTTAHGDDKDVLFRCSGRDAAGEFTAEARAVVDAIHAREARAAILGEEKS